MLRDTAVRNPLPGLVMLSHKQIKRKLDVKDSLLEDLTYKIILRMKLSQ